MGAKRADRAPGAHGRRRRVGSGEPDGSGITGTIVVDARGEFIEVDAGAQQLAGLAPGQRLSPSVNPNWLATLPTGVPWRLPGPPARRTLATGKPCGETVTAVTGADGAERWIAQVADPLFRGSSTEPYAVRITLRDVKDSRRRQAATVVEAALENGRGKSEHEERLHTLLENAFEGVIVVQADGEIEWVSGAVRLLGYDPNEMSSDSATAQEMVHPDDIVALADAFFAVIEEPATKRVVRFRQRHLDGRWMTMEGIVTNLLHEPSVKGVVINARDVSETLAAEAEVSRREAWFRALVEEAFDCVTVWDDQVRPWFVSEGSERTLGYGPDEFIEIAGNLADYVHPDDLVQIGEAYAAVLAEPGARVEASLRLLQPDGTYRHIECVLRNLIHHPEIGGVVVNGRDVTERVLAQEAVEASERRFRTLVESAYEVVLVFRADGTVEAPSVAADHEPASGDESVGELDLTALHDLVHPDDLQRVGEAFDKVSQRPGRAVRVQYRLLQSDLTWSHQQAVVRNLLDVPEVAGIVMNIRDVTAQVRAEEGRHESESRFAAAFEGSPIGMGLLDQSGEFIQANRSMGAMLGCTAADLRGRPLSELAHADDVERDAGQWAALCAGQTTDYQVEKRYCGADGAVIAVRQRVSRIAGSGVAYALVQWEDLTELREFEARMTHQTLHDGLTGLPNRTLLVHRLEAALEQARAGGPSVALLLCDLDRFQLVNDTLGHHVGDQLLIAVAERMKAAVRGEDVVARFGGDEFVVLCSGVGSLEEARRLGERVAGGLGGPVMLAGTEFEVRASVGIAVSADEADLPSDLMRDADVAMNRAKELGRGRVEVFDPELRSHLVKSAESERELRQAIERRELRVFYQPLVNLQSGAIAGVEALVRWQHPERGLVPPVDFIPLAEQTGLIVPLGAWVLEEACGQLAIWQHEGLVSDRFTMTVNLSARQLLDSQLVDLVSSVVRDRGVDPAGLCLEVTESVLVEDEQVAMHVLRALRETGIHLAIDDFGTGYSALNNLRRFPFDTLKIDRSFVSGLVHEADADAIVVAIVGMARAMNLQVVAEGIETPVQLDAVRRHGCDTGQGYLFSAPKPAGDVSVQLSDQPYRQAILRSA